MERYAVAQLDQIETVDDGRGPMSVVRQHFGITTFGVTARTAAMAGDTLVGEHNETEPESSEELYVVLSGHATFHIDGTTHEAPASTFVHVRPGVSRSANARDAGTTVLAVGAGPEGRPYRASGWERFASLFPLFDSEEWDQGADRAEALLAEDPSVGASVYYNTACFESRAGRIDAAIDHLRHALEQAPSMVKLARDDEDFVPLHDHPAFAQLTAE